MGEFIGCDAHKKYSVFVSVDKAGQFGRSVRVPHERESYRQFLATLPSQDCASRNSGVKTDSGLDQRSAFIHDIGQDAGATLGQEHPTCENSA